MSSDRESGLPLLGKETVRGLFARRHESEFARGMARSAIRDAQLWLRLTRGKTRRQTRRLGHVRRDHEGAR